MTSPAVWAPRADLVELTIAQQPRGRAVVELRVQALKPGLGDLRRVRVGDRQRHAQREPQSLLHLVARHALGADHARQHGVAEPLEPVVGAGGGVRQLIEAPLERLVAAQENFDKTMARVNDWIVDGIEKGAQSSIITLG